MLATGRHVRDGLPVVLLGVRSADDHGEGVVEAKGRLYLDVETVFVEAGDGFVDSGGVAVEGLFEDGGEGGAGVLGIGVDAAGDEGLMAEVGAGEVEAAVDLLVSLGFNLLGEEFAEDDLLGEVLGSDGDAGGAWRGAGGEEEECGEEEFEWHWDEGNAGEPGLAFPKTRLRGRYQNQELPWGEPVRGCILFSPLRTKN